MKEKMLVKVDGIGAAVAFSKITQDAILKLAQDELAAILDGTGVQATQALTRKIFDAMQVPNLIEPGESVSIRGFGTFTWKVSNPRTKSYNPRTQKIEETNATPRLRLKFEASECNQYTVSK